MVRFGAEMVFSSKDSTITDEDIDRIIAKGEEATAELDAKMKKFTEDAIKFKMDDSMLSNVLQFLYVYMRFAFHNGLTPNIHDWFCAAAELYDFDDDKVVHGACAQTAMCLSFIFEFKTDLMLSIFLIVYCFDRKRTRLILRRLLVIIGLNHQEERGSASNCYFSLYF